MSRRRRRCIAAALAAIVVLAVLVLLPPIQTALVRRLVGGVEGADITLGRVAAGPWGVTLDRLRVTAPGIDIEVPRAEVNLGFWSSLGRLSLDVERVAASGIRITAGSPPEGAEERREPTAFDGVAGLLRLPKRLVIRRAQADGTIETVVSSSITISGPWSLAADDVGPDRQAEATIGATLEAVRDGETIAAAKLSMSVEAAVDGDGAVTGLRSGAGLHADSEEPRGLDAEVIIELTEGSESYGLTVDGARGHHLVDLAARFFPDRRVLESRWSAAVAPDLFATFARGRSLPELAVTSTGKAVLDLEGDRLEIDADGRVEGRGWARLDARLGEVDEVVADADVSAILTGGRLEARELRIGIADPDGRTILRVEATQPLTIDREGWRFIPQTWGEPALRLEADRCPLRWTRGFDAAVMVEAGELSAAIDIVPINENHAEIVSHKPTRVLGAVLRAAGDEEVSPTFDLILEPHVTLDHGALEAEIGRARLTAATGFDLRFGGRATTSRERWPVVGLEGEVSMFAPRLQRMIDSVDRVAGRARFDLDLGGLVLAVDDAALDVFDPDGHAMVAVRFENDEALPVALPSMTPDWVSVAPQRVEVVVDGFPIGWVSPFIPELEIDGGTLFGELEAVGGSGLGLTLESVEPFEVRDLQPVYRGRTFATGSTASVEPSLRLDNESIRVAFENIKVRTPRHDRLDGEVVFDAPRDSAGRVGVSAVIEGEFPTITDRIGRLGALSWHQKAVIDVADRRLEVSDLEVGLTDVAGTRFLELSSVRPFLMRADPFSVDVDGGSPEILKATIAPLELQRLFPQVLGFRLQGVLPQGDFVGRVEDGGLLMVAEEELTFRNVTVTWDRAALLDRVSIGLEYQVLYSEGGLVARSIDFSVFGSSGTPIGDATLRAVMPLTDRNTITSLHFEAVADLEPLTRQPIFDGLPAFLGGTIGARIDVDRGETSTLAGALRMRDARVENAGVLPDLTAALDVASVPGQRLDVELPVRLSSSDNGETDLAFDGELLKRDDGIVVDASLAGGRIAVADVMRLVRLVAPSGWNAEAKELRERLADATGERWSKTAIAQLRERRDSTPVWGNRVSGRAVLDLGTVQLPRYAVRDVRGAVEVDPTRVELTRAEASLLGADLEMTGRLGFDDAEDRPYGLRFESAFTGLDLGALFREVDPDAPPTLEGLFDVHSEASGEGRNLADLGLGALGSVHISGRDGVFRGLAGRHRIARTGAKVIGFLTFSKQLKAIGRLLDRLEALEFETFDLELARETPQRFAISELLIVSPLARIDGGGGIEVEPGVPLAASPLDATFDVATLGDLTILFNGLGLLGPEENEGGYRSLTRPVTVGGTVAEPDTSDFYEMMNDAARDSKGVAGVAMRRINKKLQRRQ